VPVDAHYKYKLCASFDFRGSHMVVLCSLGAVQLYMLHTRMSLEYIG
jgi:hypothetical protein